eukprot:gnl/TRDRNA2_/TRDRNA2_194921_c0_seq1.p1 gnl/TRDRNA2_/TRDRNA2_194921_c0~~gnl/TRDRNA2_/TRDRNA2_194921_c0_seq1.p1  ORF type:complete len:237 (+),score=38.75 gnl/TRDRNA2_/TRDRNA2_194921_c0_seq1:118-828(+)
MAEHENDRGEQYPPRNCLKVGDEVLIFSMTNWAWTPGTVVVAFVNEVKVMYYMDGRFFTKVCPFDSAGLRSNKLGGTVVNGADASGTSVSHTAPSNIVPKAAEGSGDVSLSAKPALGTTEQRQYRTLSTGTSILIYSCRAGGWVDAVMKTTSPTQVTCTYFVKQSCCLKTLPLQWLADPQSLAEGLPKCCEESPGITPSLNGIEATTTSSTLPPLSDCTPIGSDDMLPDFPLATRS